MSVRTKRVKQAASRIVRVVVCDKCGEEVAAYPERCWLCGRHYHIVCDPGQSDGADGEHYCGRCWKLGEPYRAAIAELERQEEAQRDEWHAAARMVAEMGKPNEEAGA